MASVNITEQKKWTYQDYLHLGEETRCEVLEGELRMTPAPELGHQDISRDLEFIMWQYVKGKKLGKVFDAPVDVVLDEENVVQPDIVFVARENTKILQKKAIVGVPDLVVEIISPSSLYHDRYQKKDLYQRFAVPEYWIVDPAHHTIEIFSLENNVYKLSCFAGEKDRAKSKVISGFELEIAEIMA